MQPFQGWDGVRFRMCISSCFFLLLAEKSFWKISFQVGMDLYKVQKQGRYENMQEDGPTMLIPKEKESTTTCMKLSSVSVQSLFHLFILLWHTTANTCKNFCNNFLPDLSINMVATHEHTHAHTHRDDAIMLKILPTMLFPNAQTLSDYAWGGVWLCPNYSILPVYRRRISLCFTLPGDVSKCRGLLSFQERKNELLTGIGLPASVEIFLQSPIASYLGSLMIWVYKATSDTANYKHLIIAGPRWVGSLL